MNLSNFQNWCSLPTPMGEFRMYDTGDDGIRLVCLGDIHEQGPRPMLRVHSSCLASEVFGANDCDCADQLRESMKMIAILGRGMIIHLHQEGRGQGLSKKISAVGAMQREGLDTVEAFEALGLVQDIRSYQRVVNLLQALGLEQIRLITNNPTKIESLQRYGFAVEAINTHPTIRRENIDYLRTKRAKLGHSFVLDVADESTEDILFYHSDQPYGELSNFSVHAVFLQGKVWPTTEHYYQAQKFMGTDREEGIRRSPTPTKAKRLAGLWKSERRGDWSSVKDSVMHEALRAKFTQHPDLRELLISTGDRLLVEHTEQDAYWGDAGDGSGRNVLGELLMRIRTELEGDWKNPGEAR